MTIALRVESSFTILREWLFHRKGLKEMIRGLTQVTWERVDVSFHESKQRYIAHNTIQASF
ncbi:hypothetical protein CsSME_00008497 [Camellia sinensis var. sinensis]